MSHECCGCQVGYDETWAELKAVKEDRDSLLAACVGLAERIERMPCANVVEPAVDVARAAIAKARGES